MIEFTEQKVLVACNYESVNDIQTKIDCRN
jgi:hypothetical protein